MATQLASKLERDDTEELRSLMQQLAAALDEERAAGRRLMEIARKAEAEGERQRRILASLPA